jgi:hypothetical protein
MNKLQKFILEKIILPQLTKEVKKFMNTKKWYQSKTIWSGIITILIAVYNTIQPLLAQYFGIVLPVIPDWVYTILGALGIYGRVSADKKIG